MSERSTPEIGAIITNLEPVESEFHPHSQHPILPTFHETPNDDDVYDYDYDQLKDEFVELLEEVKTPPMKERKKLSKVRNDKKLK